MPSEKPGRTLTVTDWEALRAFDPAKAWEAVHALDPEAVAIFVEDLCEQFVRDYPETDDEKLISLGVMLSHASHPSAVDAALHWLAAAPSPARFRVVCALLRGLWLREGTAQCTDDRVARLLAVHDGIKLGVWDEYCFAWALLQATRCGRQHDSAIADRIRASFLASTSKLPPSEGDQLRSLFTAGSAE